VGGRADSGPLELPQGTYQVTLAAEGYQPGTRTVVLNQQGAALSSGEPWPSEPLVLKAKAGRLTLAKLRPGSTWKLIGAGGAALQQATQAGTVEGEKPQDLVLNSVNYGTYELQVTCPRCRNFFCVVAVSRDSQELQVRQPLVGNAKWPSVTGDVIRDWGVF
jgi:hypothetical protein